MKIIHKILIFLCCCLFSAKVAAQLNATTIGSAVDQGSNCYIITPDAEFQSGGVWYNNPIDFDEDFTIYYQNNFGNKDIDGADGMALVFKGTSVPEIGDPGGGLGFRGISPSLVVEFDTWQNPENTDPAEDHIAILRNGNPIHNNSFDNLAGPVQASISSGNIEDGADHEIKIDWDATTKTLRVFFDCNLRLSLNLDIKTTIFSGDDTVFFGFVGSTGGFSNLHQLCFNSISFVQNLNLVDSSVCAGDSINLDASIPSGNTYSWSPTTGVSNPNIANPIITPSATTTYTVTIGDVCGETFTDDVTITVLPLQGMPTFPQVPDICSGASLSPLPLISNEGISGTWSPALSNTTTTTYIFTPDDLQCAPDANMTITVIPNELPTFTQIAPICFGDILPPLPIVSNEGITGSWSPAIDNTATTTYFFTPDAGQCALQQTMVIEVNPIVTPIFTQVSPICIGEALNALPLTSNNGISGTWSPALNNTLTTEYTFTPNTGECASEQTMTITVNPNELSVFTQVAPICFGESLTALPMVSNNGVSGVWTPAINQNQTTTYTFTPDPGFCPNPVEMTIVVNENPSFLLEDEYFICFDSTGDIVIPVNIDTGLNTQDYTFSWSLNGTVINGANQPEFSPLIGGNYEVLVQNNTTLCETRITILVIELSEPIITIDITSNVFVEDQTVEVVITESGDFEFRLDNGTWQDSPTFLNVSIGEHFVTVRDKRGCLEYTEAFVVIGYPRFFTPNGDGENETWNIVAPSSPNSFLATAEIFIFDRYGKLLKQLNPNGDGWTGIYNGQLMPTSDYWFVINYNEPNSGERKRFTAHFTLKR